MIDRTHKLSLTKQAKVLGISLGSIYYRSRPLDFCIEAVAETLARHGKSDIFNTYQNSQFTYIAFTQVMKDAEIKISIPLDDCLQSPAGYRWQRSPAG